MFNARVLPLFVPNLDSCGKNLRFYVSCVLCKVVKFIFKDQNMLRPSERQTLVGSLLINQSKFGISLRQSLTFFCLNQDHTGADKSRYL